MNSNHFRATTLGTFSGLALLAIVLLLPLTGLAGSKPNDVRPGMPIEDATRVAIRCIQAASRMKTRDIRLQDTLSFVGINDAMRLDALRRHIIRDTNIGVQSVDADHKGLTFDYIITNAQLADVETKWTVAKLAKTITERAGIPRMSYKRAAQVITLCRKSTADINLTTVVSGDMPAASLDCLLGEKTGVESAGLSDPKARYRRYKIDVVEVRSRITGGWNYQQLMTFIADHACIPGLNAGQPCP